MPGTAQPPQTEAPGDLSYDTGAIVNGTYSNQCLGFWFPIPSGWEVSAQGGGAGTSLRATHLPGEGLELLDIRRNTGRITLIASGVTNDLVSAQDYVTGGVETQIRFDPANRELLRATFAVEYGGTGPA